jgi:hypothetical protein
MMELGKFINLIDTNITLVQHMWPSIFNFLNITRSQTDGKTNIKVSNFEEINKN